LNGYFDGFDWDDGNTVKSERKHGIDSTTVESLFELEPVIKPDPAHSSFEPRYFAVGKNRQGRWMLVCFTVRVRDGQRLLRPISARYMHAKEVRDHGSDPES
jgi:uncharacterized DUF497 family protein